MWLVSPVSLPTLWWVSFGNTFSQAPKNHCNCNRFYTHQESVSIIYGRFSVHGLQLHAQQFVWSDHTRQSILTTTEIQNLPTGCCARVKSATKADRRWRSILIPVNSAIQDHSVLCTITLAGMTPPWDALPKRTASSHPACRDWTATPTSTTRRWITSTRVGMSLAIPTRGYVNPIRITIH